MTRRKPQEEDSSRFLFENAPVGILYADLDGRLLVTNPFLRSIFGFPERMKSGKDHLQDFDIVRQTGFLDDYRLCVQSGQPIVAECDLPSSGSVPIRIRYYFTPDFAGKKLKGARSVVVDISARKKVEKEISRVSGYLDSLISSISPLVTVDEKLYVRFVNKAFEHEFHLARKKAEGKKLTAILKLSREDRSILLANIEKSKHGSVENQEFRIRERVFGYTVFHFRDDTGIILKNITDTKKLENRVKKLHSRLLHIQERERQNIASELHDSVGQTILAAKINLIASLDEANAERFPVGLGLIDQASQELREIYTNLYPSALKELGLEAAVRSFAKSYMEVKKCRTELIFSLVSKKIPHEIEVNIFRIIQEIFSNAMKHSGAEKITLELRGGKKELTLKVKDNGAGFDPQQIRLAGRGFGLDNMRRRVEDMGGELKIRSGPGLGTQTEIRVPLK